jgi:hypothetical protein
MSSVLVAQMVGMHSAIGGHDLRVSVAVSEVTAFECHLLPGHGLFCCAGWRLQLQLLAVPAQQLSRSEWAWLAQCTGRATV